MRKKKINTVYTYYLKSKTSLSDGGPATQARP